MAVNIDPDNKDPFYRYKMPRMITKIEGRGNGIKTNIVNMVDIAKALARPPSYTTKYFGCELGAQSKFDEKSGTALVNGSHDSAKLVVLLENFIKKFVQCYGCHNPETEVIITKRQLIELKCAACGFVSDVDMRDKLTSFIIKNPPVAKKSSKEKKAMRQAEKERLKEGEAADEQAKKLKAKAKKSSKDGGPKDDNEARVEDDDDDIQWQTDTSMEAAQKRIREQLNAVTSDMVCLSTEEVDSHETLVNNLKDFIATNPTRSQLKSHLDLCSGTPQEIVDALIEALFHAVDKGFAKEVDKKKNYLLAAVAFSEGSRSVLLHGIELFCTKANPIVVKEVALALKYLYDADVLEEDGIIEWYEKGSSGPNKSSLLWKNVKPFVEWLQSAESESEEE